MSDASEIHRGVHDGDDIAAVAAAVMRAAEVAEESAIPVVAALAAAIGGQVRREDTRRKRLDSVLEKLDRFRRHRSPHYRLARFNDALRFTIVVPDLIYWRAAMAAPEALAEREYSVKRFRRAWPDEGYKGINLTVITPVGYEFEVQFHTERSLEAAEATHDLYAAERKLPPGSPHAVELRAEQAVIWRSVPVPPGAPEVG